MPDPLLAATDIVAGYVPDLDILQGCSLELFENEIVGVVGPNGAGKSTLVKALFGLVAIRTGTVSLRGKDITGLPAHKMVAEGVGYVPQRGNVFGSLSVEENLRMGLYLRPRDFADRFDAVAEMFPILRERRRQHAGSLSGGERQLVAMARALMMKPSVLLLDEPSAGLAPTMMDGVFARIETINSEGVAIVIVEQNARRCLEVAHRGYVLDEGANAYTGSGDELLNDPKVIELYLGTLAQG